MKIKSIKKIVLSALLSASVCFADANLSYAGEYMPGDFHQHTLYTDGRSPIMQVMEENANYGLEWWANSEHGGRRPTDGEGVSWLDTGKYPVNPILGDNPAAGQMYRWQSLRDFAYPQIETTRKNYPRKTVISGLEWNVPGHEHCSTAVYGYDDTANLISEFEFRFDKSDTDTSRVGETGLLAGWGALAKNRTTKEDAVLGVQFMQALKDQELGDAWVVPAHIERARSYKVEDFRNWNTAGPDVAIGFEGTPGHQADLGGRGGFGAGADGGGTYGGSGYYCAKVGGLWDALLMEGRNWWNFASSDYHQHWTVGGDDFWPGEYQKNYTYIDACNYRLCTGKTMSECKKNYTCINDRKSDKLQAVFDGLRSGNSWHVMGDLIDELEFTAHGKGNIKTLTCCSKGKDNTKATMGQILKVAPGTMVTLKIKVHDPANANNCPFDMDNPSLAQIGISQPLNKPVLDHIDLIAGEWSPLRIDPNDPEYTNPANPNTSVAARFIRHGEEDKNGYLTYVYKFKAEAGKSMYFRLRGTNMAAGVPYETDGEGNPLLDFEARNNIYSGMDIILEEKLLDGVNITTNEALSEVAEAYADLWFYSNPIFIEVE